MISPPWSHYPGCWSPHSYVAYFLPQIGFQLLQMEIFENDIRCFSWSLDRLGLGQAAFLKPVRWRCEDVRAICWIGWRRRTATPTTKKTDNQIRCPFLHKTFAVCLEFRVNTCVSVRFSSKKSLGVVQKCKTS